MNKNTLSQKEQELNAEFEKTQKEATAIEMQIKDLQGKYQEKIGIMTRLQGAFAVIQDLKKVEAIESLSEIVAKPAEKAPESPTPVIKTPKKTKK